jgi:hypothetical protein
MHSKRQNPPLKERIKRKYRLTPYTQTTRVTGSHKHKSLMTQYTVGKSNSFSSDLMLQLQSLMDTYESLPPVIEVAEEENWDNDIRPPIPSVLVEAFDNVKL